MPVRTIKRRYIALKILGDELLNRFQLIDYVKSCLSQIDSVELDKVKLRLIELDLERKNGIIRCNHKYSKNVKDCLQDLRIGDSEIIVRVLGVSGTIKALRRKFLTN